MQGSNTTRPGGKKSQRAVALAVALMAASALAGCASLGNLGEPSVTEKNDGALYGASQSNLSSLSQVIESHPSDPQAYNMRGSAYGEAGMDEQALADFNKAIGLDPNYAQAYANRALVYRHLNKLDLALADYDKALTLDASYPPAYLGRGIVYRLQGRAAQSLADFNKVIALRPNDFRSLLRPRPALSNSGPASVRHQRFFDCARAHAGA